MANKIDLNDVNGDQQLQSAMLSVLKQLMPWCHICTLSDPLWHSPCEMALSLVPCGHTVSVRHVHCNHTAEGSLVSTWTDSYVHG